MIENHHFYEVNHHKFTSPVFRREKKQKTTRHLDLDTWAKPCGGPAGAAAAPRGPPWEIHGTSMGNPWEILRKSTEK